MPAPTQAHPATGIRQTYLIIRDGSSPARSRRMLCMDLSIPSIPPPAQVPVKLEGILRAVLAGDDVEGTFSFSVPISAFMDATQPTLEEIQTGTGAGADWTPINPQMDVAVSDAFRCFYYDFYISASDLGARGPMTRRSVQGFAKLPESWQRADPNVIAVEGIVYGTVTDSVVSALP